MGKSTLADFLASQLSRNKTVFDPGDQYKNFEVHTSELKQVEREFSRGDWQDYPLSLSYIPPVGPDPTADEIEPYWNHYAAILWQFTGQHDGGASYSLIVDEASELQSPTYVNPWLARFIRRAPRRERGDRNPVDIIQTFHRPQDLNGIVESQVDVYYFFNMVKARDLEVIRKNWGEDVAEAVSNLRTPRSEPAGRDVLRLEAETGKWEVITDDSSWFVDIRKSPDEPKHIPSGWITSSLHSDSYIN